MSPRRPLQVYFVAVGVLVVIAGAATAAYVFVQSNADARQSSTADAAYAAVKAAAQVEAGFKSVDATSKAITANPANLQSVFNNPKGCQLTYAPLGAFDTGRLEILRLNGSVVCSSQGPVSGTAYAGQPWLQASSSAVMAPATDPLTGHQVAIATYPIGSLGILAWFIDLAPIGPKLASEYGTGVDQLEFLVVSSDGRSIITRSVDSARWSGAQLAGTSFAPSSDVTGTPRWYAQTGVAGTGWKMYVGADQAFALAGTGQLQQRQLGIVAGGVLLTLLALVVVYRAVARPIASLSSAVQSSRDLESRVPVAGPLQVAALGESINGLIASLKREVAGREKAEQTYSRLFSASPLPMTVTDLKTGSVILANAAALRAFGYTEEEFRELNRTDLQEPQTQAKQEQMAALRQHPDATFTKVGPITFRKKDGSLLRGTVTSYRVELEGNPAMVATIEDITEKEMTERRLAQAERSFIHLFEGNPLPILTIRPSTLEILDVNEAAMKSLGYTRDRFRSLKTSDLTVADDAAQAARLKEIRDSQLATLRFGPLSWRKGDGSFMRATETSYIIDYGEERVRVAMLEDVTEKEKVERQLAQSQRLETLGQLAGGVAHDFNNLLTVILNVTESLKSTTPDAESARDLERVDKAAQSAKRLTRQLLAFARRDVVPQSVLNLSDRVADLKDLLARTIGSHVVLTAELPPDLWPVLMDRGQLEQIVINLVVNARDAMPRGGTLDLSLENFVVDEEYAAGHQGIEPGRFVKLQVSDSGTGMDRATLDRVFEPFFTTKPVGQGTGMGLATVYGIVKQLKGAVSIYSEVGRGTTVTVLLPVTTQAPAREEPPAPAVGHARVTGTVLAVEDYADLRELFDEILKGAGYRVLTAPDGEAALAMAREHVGEIDLLLTDIVMPHMLGTDLARQLKAEQPNLRVIFMSGHAQPVAFANADLPAGATLLQKPFMEAELLDRVREVLSTEVPT